MSAKKWPILPPDSRWTIIGEAGLDSYGYVTYHVICSCSDKITKIVSGRKLATYSRSCGCLLKKWKWPILPPDSRWTIISQERTVKRKSMYRVQCSCVNKTQKIVCGTSLTAGSSKSCGCLKSEITSRIKRVIPVLPENSRWRVLKEAGKNKHGSVVYLVECSCAAKNRKILAGFYIDKGLSLSCGCLKTEITSERSRRWPIIPFDSRWRIICQSANSPRQSTMYLVECSCIAKTQKVVMGSRLTSGRSRSCGCLKRETTYFIKKVSVFLPTDSRWSVIKEAGRTLKGTVTYLVECSCHLKTRKILDGVLLRRGGSKSCGCIRRETIKETIKNRITLSKAIEQFGYLTNIEETIENIQKEIDPCDSESTSQKIKPSKRPKRSSVVSSTG